MGPCQYPDLVCGYGQADRRVSSVLKWFRNAAIDLELSEILDNHQRVRQDATLVRDYLVWVLEQAQNGEEKFSDKALERASQIYEQVGVGAFYWMTDIAAQMVLLAEASLRGVATNVSEDLGKEATAHAIVQSVVRIP